jgi:hypothetical protein
VGRIRSGWRRGSAAYERGSAPTGDAPCQAGQVAAGGASPPISVPGILERRRLRDWRGCTKVLVYKVKASQSYA